jgi:2-oxoglutarate dehydrogenase complex dehydrogenase (E1) component-like enzyme
LPESVVDPNVFETANAGFAQVLYEDWLKDPNAVSPEWRSLFESGRVGERPAGGNGDGRAAAAAPPQGSDTSSSTAHVASAPVLMSINSVNSGPPGCTRPPWRFTRSRSGSR